MNKKIEKIRHSLAHIMALAVKGLYSNVKFGTGPITENGFYYDFKLAQSLSPADLPKIEEKIKGLIKKNLKFKKKFISKDQAKKLFKDQPFKLELIKDKLKRESKKLSIYKCGNFIDLCKGPHIKSTKEINLDGFKIIKMAGAYWRNDKKNPMLTRIYGLAFETKKGLDDHLKMIKEAEKRDHRKLGKELRLFHFCDEIGQGLPLWLPNGTIIREELEKWAKGVEKEQGYQRVATPHITKSRLFYISGHLPHYADDMYPPFEIDKEEYYLKPMNCPFHHMIYKSSSRSYRELPLRLAEYGTVYRYELSGALNGLMRVRGLCQNDAHIYCSMKQAKHEFLNAIRLHQFYYKKLGIKDYYMELSLRDPKDKKKYHGNNKMWNLAEKLTRQAMQESKIPYIEKIGDAAFYGPKIDFIIKTAIGKEYAISTNQLDLYMGKKFGLEYTDHNGKKQTPVIIHRAPLGSHERFIAFLIEHFAGAFPFWLSPIQIWIIPISDKHLSYAKKILSRLKEKDYRVELKNEKETICKKIRDGENQKIPYLIIIGDKEIESKKISIRQRKKGDLGQIKLEKFLEIIKKLQEDRLQ